MQSHLKNFLVKSESVCLVVKIIELITLCLLLFGARGVQQYIINIIIFISFVVTNCTSNKIATLYIKMPLIVFILVVLNS